MFTSSVLSPSLPFFLSFRYSLALNFDEYETDWRNLGTSLPSDALRKRVTQADTFGMSSC